MVTASFATLIGFSMIAVALVAVFFSPYRHWLGFMLAGMTFWGVLEVIRIGLQVGLELPMAYSYIAALTFAMGLMIVVLLREDRLAQQAVKKRQYIEHTPVYDEDQQYSSR